MLFSLLCDYVLMLFLLLKIGIQVVIYIAYFSEKKNVQSLNVLYAIKVYKSETINNRMRLFDETTPTYKLMQIIKTNKIWVDLMMAILST